MSYAAATATAKSLIGRRGKKITLTRKGQGAIDPIAGTRASGANKIAQYVCVGLPPGRSAEFQVGSLVNRKIQMFYMAQVQGARLDPSPGDIVPWAGKNWTLIWSATYDPDDSGAIMTQAYGEIA